MFNAVFLSLFHLSPPRPPLSIYGNSLSFAIDPPLAANEKDLRFLGFKTGLLAFWNPGFFFSVVIRLKPAVLVSVCNQVYRR